VKAPDSVDAYTLPSSLQEALMKKALLAATVAVSVAAGFAVHAQVQSVQRPYRNGTVWTLGFIRMEPGMDVAYLNFVASEWKREQEALKKEGVILSYKVLQTEDHGPDDWNLILMTEVKDLATFEANEQKAEAIALQLVGGDEKNEKGYQDRLRIRRVIGGRLAREIVLAPRQSK
jgi:hypothetical protein